MRWLPGLTVCFACSSVDPQLWVQALSYFAGRADGQTCVAEVLGHVERQQLMPPLLVVQTLALSATAPLAVVRDYVVRQLQQEADQIAEDERLIRQYTQETQRMKAHINDLRTSATIFRVSKCHVCDHPLEVPSVHFLCQHSFHQQ